MNFPLLTDCIVGGIKIKDGQFIGDMYAAQDLEFMYNNKISHIINCSPNEVPNHFECQGQIYLTIPWKESDFQILFSPHEETLRKICDFIDMANDQGESVQVHSVKGQSRASCAICSYFMKSYRWGFYKTLEFQDSRRPDLEIRKNFFDQLEKLADLISETVTVSNNWDVSACDNLHFKNEENIIRNTFLNSKIASNENNLNKKSKKGGKKKGKVGSNSPGKKLKKIKWIDQNPKFRANLG